MGIYVERAMSFWSKTLADERNTGIYMCGVCAHVRVCVKQKLYKGDLANSLILQNQGALRTPWAQQKSIALEILPVHTALRRTLRLVGLGN